MRDPLCSESYLLETIEFDKEANLLTVLHRER